MSMRRDSGLADVVPDPAGLLSDPAVEYFRWITYPRSQTSDTAQGDLLGRDLNHRQDYRAPERCRYCEGAWPCWAERRREREATGEPQDRPAWP